MLVVIALPTVGYIVINQNNVQNYIVQKVSNKLSAFFGAPVTVRHAQIDLFSNIILEDFCVKSPHHDTIFYAPRMEIKLSEVSISSKYVEFKKINFIKPKIHCYVDSTNTISFQFIINKLEAKDTIPSAHPLRLTVGEVVMQDADFTLRSFYYVPKKFGVNFGDIHLTSLNTKVTNFRMNRGVTMNIRKMSATDHSGFKLEQLSSRFKIDKRNMVFSSLHVVTPESNIEANRVAFNFNTTKDFKVGVFGKKVNLDIDMAPSDISTNDVAWVMPFLKDNHLRATVSGTFKGRFSDLKGRNIEIIYGDNTKVKGNIDINGLPDVASSFLHVDIKSLYTTPSDIEKIRLPKSVNGRIVLPPSFKNVKYITYKGKFTGFLNDFVAYGKFSSNLGNIESDLSLRPDTANYFSFNGSLKAIKFDIGQFLNKTDLMGKISLNAMVNGNAGTLRNPRANLDGMITSFEVNHYNYQNIKINGNLSNNTYDGSLKVEDPNVIFDFLGKVDLSQQVPRFNFKADVKGANLYKLNFEKKDTGAFVSFYATADFEGNNIDNLNGEIKLWNSTLKRTGKEIQINDFLLFTKTIKDTNRIILRSDLADAEVWGTYQFLSLKNSFVSITRNFLPSLVAGQPFADPGKNNFKFEIEFKDTRQLTDFFVPGLYVSRDSKLSGHYNPSVNYLDLKLYVPLLQHGSKKWYNLDLSGQTTGKAFSVVAGSNNLKLSNQIELKNFTIDADIKGDSVNTHFRWNNWDTLTYKGNFTLAAAFKPSPNKLFPLVSIDFKPSQFVLKDTVWNVTSGIIRIDSSRIKINNFLLAHNNQNVSVDGVISREKDSALSVVFNRVDLSNISTVLNTRKLALNGIVNGSVNISNIYGSPIFKASMGIDSLMVNHEPLGNTKVNAQYQVQEKKIKAELFSERGSTRIIDAKGYYSTQDKTLNFDIDINKFKINIIEPYLSNIFSDIRGMATGNLQLTGTWNDPLFNGNVKFQKCSFVVNYLKTRYNFTNSVDVKNNTFQLKNAEVYDARASKALVNGWIEYRKLKDIYSDLKIKATNFACLNTTENDNNIYYGVGYATGDVRIQTSPKGVVMDVDATSADGNPGPDKDNKTKLYIPLSNKSSVTSDVSFIRFVKKQQIVQKFDQYEIDNLKDSRKINISSKFKMNCVLHVDPSAEIQIILDKKAGDQVTGKGSGTLKMEFENGNFTMDGKYTIEEGTYLFTIPNAFINKSFTIENGGTIVWDGSPFDAIIDVVAKYEKVKAPLAPALVPATPEHTEFTKPIQTVLLIKLRDKLLSPSISYDIDLPNATSEAKTILQNAISTEEGKSQQFLALLFANNFIADPSAGGRAEASNSLGLSAASSTGVEFLSNQFSRMFSQYSKDVDIGFNYRPGNYVTTSQAEMAFSAQVFKGRLLINGNFDVLGSTATKNTSSLVGEGNIEYKLNENGKLRLKAFNRSNQQSTIFEMSPYTQGLGVFYKEDFNSFKGLMAGYFDKLFGKKEENVKPVNDSTDEGDSQDE